MQKNFCFSVITLTEFYRHDCHLSTLRGMQPDTPESERAGREGMSG